MVVPELSSRYNTVVPAIFQRSSKVVPELLLRSCAIAPAISSMVASQSESVLKQWYVRPPSPPLFSSSTLYAYFFPPLPFPF